MKIPICLSIIVLVVTVGGAQGRKSNTKMKTRFSVWAACWDRAKAREALLWTAPKFEEVDLFAYHFSETNALVPADANFRDLLDSFHAIADRKPRLAITLVNDVVSGGGLKLKDSGIVHQTISTPEARSGHIKQILDIAEAAAAESIDIDYERVAIEDGPAFTLFIQSLADALHKKGKRLSVVVEPRISEMRSLDPLSNGSNAVSWKEVAKSADQVTVMAYLYHYSGSEPGSIAPIDWISQIAVYGLENVPAEKLSIALHLGGIDWSTNGPAKSLDFDRASALAAAYGASVQLDKKTQSGFFSYSDNAGRHDVWIETAAGLQAKIKALKKIGIQHIAFWRLGAGEETFWDSL